MLFSSYVFVFAFLPIVLLVYFALAKAKTRVPQHLFLVAASLFFYGYFRWTYLPIIILSVVINYLLSIAILRFKKRKKAVFILGILFNIGLLGFYKYANFILQNIDAVTGFNIPLLNILLPLGISFFTFQQFSFLLNVYKTGSGASSFIDYFLFVTFFAQLVAGPIVTYEEMMPQFEDNSKRRINADNIASGIFYFVLGLSKKLIIADSLALFVDNGYMSLESFGFAAAWVVSLCYTFQIYFDFSGYSDMAIGLGKMFNINLPLNFNSPYKSKSITEFWRRWHITLGRALSQFVYIPLGGNRKGTARTYLNLIVTFTVSGLWHGAAWTFVLWGMLHGLFTVLDRVFERFCNRLPGFIRVLATFTVVHFLWVLFRAPSITKAFDIYKSMFQFTNIQIEQLVLIGQDGVVQFPPVLVIAYAAALLALCFVFSFAMKNTNQLAQSFRYTRFSAVVVAAVFIVAVIHMSRVSPFIYFNF